MVSRRRDTSGTTHASSFPHHLADPTFSRIPTSSSFITMAATTTVTTTTTGAEPVATKSLDPHIHLHPVKLNTDMPETHASVAGTTASEYLAARFAKLRNSVNVHVIRTFVWICLAGLSAGGVAVSRGSDRALEFLTAYIVEYSLSVDNLFVFLLIFQYFKVPREAQETVLFWGIIGAMVLRGVMIVLGKALVERFEWVSVGFAAVLIYSAIKLILEDDDDDEDLENNKIVRFARRLVPVTDKYNGERFFVFDSGTFLATPLVVVLISVELSDVVFALDSVPAVLGISKDSLVIYSSNILAVMGLRSLFFVISDAIKNLRFLKQSLAVVLGFIGLKMVFSSFGHQLNILLSLGVVTGTLTLGIILSVLFPLPEEEEKEAEDPASPQSQAAGDVLPPV